MPDSKVDTVKNKIRHLGVAIETTRMCNAQNKNNTPTFLCSEQIPPAYMPHDTALNAVLSPVGCR